MFLKIEELLALGVSRSTIFRNIAAGLWQTREAGQGRNGKPVREILSESLPLDLQLRLQSGSGPSIDADRFESAQTEGSSPGQDPEHALAAALKRIPLKEREAWIAEAQRLAKIIERYRAIRPKRSRSRITCKLEFVPEVRRLCKEAACRDSVIIAREPHRARPPSPHTLDYWLRAYLREGMMTFLRPPPPSRHLQTRRQMDQRQLETFSGSPPSLFGS